MKLFNIIILMTVSFVPLLAYSQGDSKSSKPATPVIVSEIKLKDFADEIEALGTLKARESVELTSAVTEIVTKIAFTDNQRIKKGEVIVEMDAAEEIAELAEQKSIISQAQKQVNRLAPLVKQGAASTLTLDENKRDLDSAKARMTAIQSRIDQRIIKAPFDGVLGLRNISIGSLAQPGSLITTIDDDEVMRLDFSVPEVFLSVLKPGLIIEAETEAYPDKVFKGEISSVDSRIDPITRSIQARALIENNEHLLKPGLLMQVELQKNPRKSLLIPEEAIITNGPDNFVFVIDKNTSTTIAKKRIIKIGTRQYGEAEIISGLKEGEQIVTHGILRIRDGDNVKITATEKIGENLEELLNKNKAG